MKVCKYLTNVIIDHFIDNKKELVKLIYNNKLENEFGGKRK